MRAQVTVNAGDRLFKALRWRGSSLMSLRHEKALGSQFTQEHVS